MARRPPPVWIRRRVAWQVSADCDLLEVARTTVTGVVHGILGTSLIQGVTGGIGFWIAGVPGAFLLGFVDFHTVVRPDGAGAAMAARCRMALL